MNTTILRRLYHQGLSERAIAAYFLEQGINVSRATIHNRLAAIKEIVLGPKRTAKKLTGRDERMLSRLIRVHNVRTVPLLTKELARRGYDVSASTIRRALKSNRNLRLQRPRKRPFITDAQRRQRLAWAKAAAFDWKAVYFGDEKAFSLDGPAWRPQIWCDKRDPPPILPRRGSHCGTVAILGCFSYNKVPNLVFLPAKYNSDRYSAGVAAMLRRGSTIVHDRHPVHKSKATKAFFDSHGIQTVLLPPKAADINPIENLWGIVAQRVYSGCTVYESVTSLTNAIQRVWGEVQGMLS